MGLDQYLWAEKFVSGSRWSPQDDQNTYKTILSEINAEEIADAETCFISTKVCAVYWRKANQIHKWFVDNVQGGNDDCGSYGVSYEQLAELRKLCAYVRDSLDSSPLPPTEGFFFGGTELDEYYWSVIGKTVEDLHRILSLENAKLFTFYYESSW